MEHKLLWGAFAVGCAGWVCLLLLAGMRRSNPDQGKRALNSFEWLSFALPLAVWIGTLPTKAPFSSGQGWGRGFLLGGLVAGASLFMASRISSKSGQSARLSSLLFFFGALVVACVPLLWMRHAAVEALLGASLAWVSVAVVWLGGMNANAGRTTSSAQTLVSEAEFGAGPLMKAKPAPTQPEAEVDGTIPQSLSTINGAAFVCALCGLCALAFSRDFVVADVARGTHPALAVVLAASLGLALLFDFLLRESFSNAQSPLPSNSARSLGLASAALCTLVPLGIGYLAATRVLDDMKVFACVGLGAGLGLLGWGLLWDASKRDDNRTQTISPVALLVALCAFMLSFALLQGFGVGLMLLAAWPVSLLMLPSGEASQGARLRFDIAGTLSLLGTFLAILLLSRVFATRFRTELRGANLSDQFALFGFLAGALVPVMLSSLWFGSNPNRSASLPRVFVVGILALVLSGAMLALWGVKVVPAFFAGLAIGLAFSPNAQLKNALNALLSLALALVLTQWTLRFLPLAELSRSQRSHYLLWGLGLSVVLILMFDLGARLLARLGRSRVEVKAPGVSS